MAVSCSQGQQEKVRVGARDAGSLAGRNKGPAAEKCWQAEVEAGALRPVSNKIGRKDGYSLGVSLENIGSSSSAHLT